MISGTDLLAGMSQLTLGWPSDYDSYIHAHTHSNHGISGCVGNLTLNGQETPLRTDDLTQGQVGQCKILLFSIVPS